MPRKSELEPVARQLFAGGMGLREVGQALGIHGSTVGRWRDAAPDKWRRARQDAGAADPEHLLNEMADLMRAICRDSSLDVVARGRASQNCQCAGSVAEASTRSGPAS